MKRIFTLLAAVAALAVVLPQPAQTQSWKGTLDRIYAGRTVSASVAADDIDVALLIKYIGEEENGEVAAEADGNLTFIDGDEGSEAATDSFECPVSGALGGIIDVSNAACDTLGEVVDIINASDDWRAVIIDGLRSDSSNDTFLAVATADATAVGGVAIEWDTTVALTVSAALVPPAARSDITLYLRGTGFQPNPFQGTRTVFWYGNATSTYGSGTSNFRVQCVRPTHHEDGAETVTTVLGPIAGGATTANKEFDFSEAGVFCNFDEKMLVRLTNSAAMATVQLVATGTHYAY